MWLYQGQTIETSKGQTIETEGCISWYVLSNQIQTVPEFSFFIYSVYDSDDKCFFSFFNSVYMFFKLSLIVTYTELFLIVQVLMTLTSYGHRGSEKAKLGVYISHK